MAGRRTKPQVNRHRYHSAKVAAARTPHATMQAYCEWLKAEVWHAGPEQARTTSALLRAHINELIKRREEAKEGAR